MLRDIAVALFVCIGVFSSAPASAGALLPSPEAYPAFNVGAESEPSTRAPTGGRGAGQVSSPGAAGRGPAPSSTEGHVPGEQSRWDDAHVMSTAAVVGMSSLGTRLMLLVPGGVLFLVLVAITGGNDSLDYALAFGGTSVTLALVDAVMGAGVSVGAYRYLRPSLEPSFVAALLGHAAGGVVSAALLGGVVGGAWMLQAALAEQSAVARPDNLALVSGLTVLASIPVVMAALVASVVLPAFGSAWATEKSARQAAAGASVGSP